MSNQLSYLFGPELEEYVLPALQDLDNEHVTTTPAGAQTLTPRGWTRFYELMEKHHPADAELFRAASADTKTALAIYNSPLN